MSKLNAELIDAACGADSGQICSMFTSQVDGLRQPIRIEEVDAADWVIFAFYFIGVIALGIISAFRNRGSINGFFLTAKSANWLLVGSSMFTSNIGSGHFIGLAGTAAAYGISSISFELNAIFILPLLGWFFAPVYLASGASTMPEYLRFRFGGRRIQVYMSCLALFLYIFTKISADLHAGTLYLEESLDLPKYAGVFLLLTIAAFSSIIGGMTAVLWTNAAQLVIILIGSFYFMGRVLDATGGIEELFYSFMKSQPRQFSNETGHSPVAEEVIETCGHAPNPQLVFHLMQPANDTNAPWPGTIFGVSILSFWYWCSDQVITQHVLASKNLSHAKLGSILAAFFKFIPPFIFLIPGMAARSLYTDVTACSDPVLCCCFCNSQKSCANSAYTLFAKDNNPTTALLASPGARGLMAITVTAALISSFTSTFNACSAIFTMDIWRLIRPKASSKELQIVGRVFIVIVCTVSMLWMVIISTAPNLHSYIQSMTAYFSPPIAAIFLLAVFWERCNEKGAFFGLMIGLLVGVVRFGLEVSYPVPGCAEAALAKHDLRPPALKNVHYLYFAIILFGITTLVTVCLSLVTKRPDKSRINGLTYFSRYEHRIIRHRRKLKRQSTSSKEESKDDEETTDHPAEDSNANTNNDQDNLMPSDQNQTSISTPTSKWRRFFSWFCGIEQQEQPAARHNGSVADINSIRRSTMERRSAANLQHGGGQVVPLSSSLYENSTMSMIALVSLVVLLASGIFFWVLLW